MSNSIINNWHILCDFDGTITPFDVTDALLESFAAPEWEDLEQAWVQGRMSARQCMEQQVRLLQVAPSELDEFLDTIPLTAGVAEFMAWRRSCGIPLHVISDGLDYAIRRILNNHDLSDIPLIANRLCFDSDGYHLDF